MKIDSKNQIGLENQISLGLDVGGTKLAGVLMTWDGSIIAKGARFTLASEGGEAVLGRLIELAEKLLESRENRLVGIGMATPGIVDLDNQYVRFVSTELPGWPNLSIAEVLSNRFGVQVLVENDGRMAALAEHRLGVGRGCADFVTVVLGTGVGGGIVTNNEIVRGGQGGGGRLGHISVDPDGPLCSCGNRGCLELYASGKALAAGLMSAIQQGRQSMLSDQIREQPSFALSGRQVVEAAIAGDALARMVIETAGKKLGLAMVQVVRMLDPEKIVIGGSISSAGDLLLAPARQILSAYSPEAFPIIPTVEKANFGRDASVIGAALLGWKAAKKAPKISKIPSGKQKTHEYTGMENFNE